MVIETEADGYPYAHLGALPPGDYWVQALVHVYTEFHRQDGHVIWAPGDQWEGQRWAFSPGNLVSAPRRVSVDPASDRPIRLVLTDVIPPIDAPPDTERVKRVRLESRILSEWWGHPMYLGAVVLLPRGYEDHPELRYPAVFEAGHFSLEPAFGFTTAPPSGVPGLFAQMLRESGGMRESGYDFQQTWTADDFPRVIAVTLQHPTPFFDDSYGLNSANNGPYGDAIHQELIPYLEEHFRMIGEPYARVLTGGSTGGWISLALQVHYPRRVWDLETGVIDRDVAFYMRNNRYDLRHYLEENWRRIGPDLVGKIRIYNPEMDQFYLPYAVYLLEDFLEGTTDPHYGGEIVHGRPMKGHGWSPFTNAELVRRMADHIAGNAPAGASLAWYAGGR